MKRTIRITMDIEVSDLSKEERRECAEIEGCSVSEIPRLKEYEAREIAELVEGLGEEGMAREFFAGSCVYAKFTSARVINAEWVDTPAGRAALESTDE